MSVGPLLISVLAVTGVLLLIAALLIKHADRRLYDITDDAPTSPKQKAAGEFNQHIPTREERIKEGLVLLNRAVALAREGSFTSAYATLEGVTRLLASDPTTELRLSAARCLVYALDANYGIAGREIATTLERLRSQWPHIDGGESTYRVIAGMCSEAMRLVPLEKVGNSGYIVSMTLRQADRLARRREYKEALTQITSARMVVSCSTILCYHPTLAKEIEATERSIRSKQGENTPENGTPLYYHLTTSRSLTGAAT